MMRAGLWCSLLLVAAVHASETRPVASADANLMGVDGLQRSGVWLGASQDVFSFRIDGQSVQIARDDLMRVTFAPIASAASRASEPQPKDVFCELAEGGTIRGRLLADREGRVKIQTSLAGEQVLRFADLRSIRFGNVGANAAAEAELNKWREECPMGYDVVIVLRDGKATAVRGALLAVGPDGGEFEFNKRRVPLRTDTTYAVVLGRSATSQPSAKLSVVLRDGSWLHGELAGADSQSLEIVPASGEHRRLSIMNVSEIRIRSDRVCFATDMKAEQIKIEPFLKTPWTFHPNRSITNGPIRLGGVEYAFGLGVHSRAELVYALNGEYKQFAAVIGIDDAVQPRGHVVFRVVADGREAYNSGPVTGKDEPRPITVDVAGVRQVQLVVEYGEELDLSDHADWANARFIR